jgi:hypothetical protein
VLYDLQYPASIVETTRGILSSLWNESFMWKNKMLRIL